MDDHAGRVHDRAQVRPLAVERLLRDRRRHRVAVVVRDAVAPALGQRPPHALDRDVASRARRELLRGRLPQDPVDRRQA